MESTAPRHWDCKYSWALIERAAPPKRPAAERIQDFREIYSDYDEDVARAQASRCIQCHTPLCVQGCPLNNRIPEWLALAADGRFIEAAAISRLTSNMPEICSRVCPQDRLCEGACFLNGLADPVAIGSVERFINDYAIAHDALEADPPLPNGRSVAVVGSGPGGLAAADQLADLGYSITIFEAQAIPGGLLVNGIPAFKLEKPIVARRVTRLKKRGVIFRVEQKLGRDVSLTQLRENFDAVFLGIGAQQPKPLDVPGASLRGIAQALPFLVQKNAPDAPVDVPPISVTGKRVVVLGGGDTAMDCLRTSLRCGAAEAVCLYRRDFANMPGSRKEYANALEEGARFQFLTNPVAIEGNANGEVARVRCVRMQLGAPDSSGRRKPQVVPGSEFTLEADLVLVAYGFDPVPFAPESDLGQIATNEWGGIVTDENLMTSIPGVFSGGDAVRGPSLVVHAVRDARRAAEGIHRYLSTQ